MNSPYNMANCQDGYNQSFVYQPPTGAQNPYVDEICLLILDILDENKRGRALEELSKHRESIPELAVWLWQSFGTMTCILQEIISVYPNLSPPSLINVQANRVCNALSLLQTIAAHPETKHLFVEARIATYVFPLLHTKDSSKQFEYLRLTSLGVIGTMVKADGQKVIKYLLTTEIVPVCLEIMERGTELSRTVSTFIMEKILSDKLGLDYVCEMEERCSHIVIILNKVVGYLVTERSKRLFKHVVHCYALLSESESAVRILAATLPIEMRDGTFQELLDVDEQIKQSYRLMFDNISKDHVYA